MDEEDLFGKWLKRVIDWLGGETFEERYAHSVGLGVASGVALMLPYAVTVLMFN